MHKSKKVCNTRESERKYCSYLYIPSCEREILLLLTVILFVFNNNSNKVYDGCYSKSNKKKANKIKNKFDLSEIYENLSCDNIIKRNDECQNETYSDLKEEITLGYYESKATPECQSSINQFEKFTQSDNCDNINDENHDKEIVNIPLPVTINEYPEEISVQNFPVENMIQSENNSYSLNICTEEKCNKTLISLGEMLKNYYKGVMVCAMLPNGIIISGEVAFNFNHIVALKYNNTIIFINEDQIISFY